MLVELSHSHTHTHTHTPYTHTHTHTHTHACTYTHTSLQLGAMIFSVLFWSYVKKSSQYLDQKSVQQYKIIFRYAHSSFHIIDVIGLMFEVRVCSLWKFELSPLKSWLICATVLTVLQTFGNIIKLYKIWFAHSVRIYIQQIGA